MEIKCKGFLNFFNIKLYKHTHTPNLRYIKCTGQSKRPEVAVLESEVLLNDIYVNVKTYKIVRLQNNGPVEAKFEWGKVFETLIYTNLIT